MAKGTRGRRRMASRHFRATPYPLLSNFSDLNKKKSTIKKPKKDWEDINCSVCMEHPHNAVLLLCSSHDKGCRPYMCGTNSRYSNCLDQYKKAYTKVKSPNHTQSSIGSDTSNPVLESFSEFPVVKNGEVAELACPLCRGQVKGWTVVESAREYLNSKKRACMHDNCSFVGAYKELKKHVKSEHPTAKPREVDPDQEQKWRQLVREREREDVISTITSSTPGSVVFGDYVIERNPYGSDSEDEEGFDVANGNGLVNVFLMFHAFAAGENAGTFGGERTHNDDDNDDVNDDDDSDNDGGSHTHSMSLVNRLRRQGRVLLGRSGRRRRIREANGRHA